MSEDERKMDQYKREIVRRAQDEADRRGEQYKDLLGEVVVEATQEYFPEQYRRQHRENYGKALAVGLIVGLVLGLLGRDVLGGEE